MTESGHTSWLPDIRYKASISTPAYFIVCLCYWLTNTVMLYFPSFSRIATPSPANSRSSPRLGKTEDRLVPIQREHQQKSPAVPEGTTKTRTSQPLLERGVSRSDRLLSTRDRQGELQQGASEACFDRPGNHSSCTLSIRVTVRPASSSHQKQQQEQPPLPSVPEVKEKMPRPREISEPSLASFVSGGTSQSGRRIAAMELFEQYNISRPSG